MQFATRFPSTRHPGKCRFFYNRPGWVKKVKSLGLVKTSHLYIPSSKFYLKILEDLDRVNICIKMWIDQWLLRLGTYVINISYWYVRWCEGSYTRIYGSLFLTCGAPRQHSGDGQSPIGSKGYEYEVTDIWFFRPYPSPSLTKNIPKLGDSWWIAEISANNFGLP